MGGKIVLKSGYGVGNDDDEDDDDDQLLLSIQKKLETLPFQRVQSRPQMYDSGEEDDDEILHSVEKMYNRPLEIAPFIQKQSHLPNPIKVTNTRKLSGNEVPSPCGSSSSGEIVKEVGSRTCLPDPGQGRSDISSELANIENGFSSPIVLLPDLDGDITPTKGVLEDVAAEHLGHVSSIEKCGHELGQEEQEGLNTSGLPRLPGQFEGRPETCFLEHGDLSVTPAKIKVKRTTEKVMNGSKEATLIAPKAPLHFLGLPGQFEDAFVENCAPDPTEFASISNSSERSILTQDALTKNRKCANMLRNLLLQIEEKQKENKELQRRMRTLIDFEKSCRRRFAGLLTNHTNLPIKLFMTSEPKHRKSVIVQPAKSKVTLEPPSNEDVETFQKLQREFPSAFNLRKWSKQESEELKKGVKQQLQENLVRQTMEALIMNQNSNDEPICFDDFMKEVAERTFTDRDVRKYFPNINWDHVARRYVVGRSAAECKIRWLNHEDGLRNHTPWTKAEDKRLLHIAQQHDLCDWEIIAQELSTNRNAAQCLIRYQRSLNATIMRSSWTPEEDEQLRMAVEIHGEKNWQAVAANIEGRTGSQCSSRWHKVVHPGRHSGRWNVEEDKRLAWSVCLYGSKQWNMIASHVPGRTDVQCRERWCNVLDPALKHEDWSEQEDKSLEEAVVKYGAHHWALVANELKTRTDNQCWRRWKLLNPEHQAAFKKDVYIRRVALVANFAGRKHERPSLGIADFVSEAGQIQEKDFETSSLQNFGTSAYAKVCRTERIEKMRLSRAEGRSKTSARKEWMDEGALSRLISSRLLVEPSAVLDGNRNCDKIPLLPSINVQSSIHVQGATCFVSMVRSIAGLCNFSNDPNMLFENYDKKFRFVDTGDQAVSTKGVLVPEKENHIRGWLGNCSASNKVALSQEVKDEEVAAATRAVLSWPFFIGLQKFWNQGLEDPIFQGAEKPENGTCRKAHDSLSFLQFVNRRKRTTHHRPRKKKLMIPENVLTLDQGLIEATRMPSRKIRKRKKLKTRTSTMRNSSHKNKTEDDPVQRSNSSLYGNHAKAVNRRAQVPAKCTEDPCIVVNSSKKRKTRGLMNISNVASKNSRKA